MDTSHELPYMTVADLDSFIQANPELNLSDEERRYLHLRRRRLSVQRIRPVEYHEGPVPVKVVALGDDSVKSKTHCLQLFLLQGHTDDALGIAKQTECAIARRTVASTNDTGVMSHHEIEVWVPLCDEKHRLLRTLYYSSAAVFLVFFSVLDRESFESAKRKWIPELRSAAVGVEGFVPPVLLIGCDAEHRRSRSPESMVASDEAVRVAQECGVTKYIEIHSDNAYHVNEVFQQSLQALGGALRRVPSGCDEGRRKRWHLDNKVFREMLTPPPPVGYFDLAARTFHVEKEPGVEYYVTLNETTPSQTSMHLSAPLKFRKPYPKVVTVRGYRQCMFPSETLVMPVPEVSAEPRGYFDVVRKTFYLLPEPGSKYHFTTDGSKPTSESPLLDTAEGLRFDTEPPMQAMGSGCDGIPEVVKVVAVSNGKFRSPVTSFTPPPLLDPPKVSEADGVLRLISALPHLEYRYTVDGTVPGYESTLYTHPIALTRDGGSQRVRIAAFPRLCFPSKPTEVVVGPLSATHSTHTTHSASNGHRTGGSKIRSTSCDSPTRRFSRSRNLSPRGSPRSGKHSVSPSRRTATTGPTVPTSRYSAQTKSSSRRSASDTPSNDVPAGRAHREATCSARNSSIDFDFENPIAISHITVATPGGGKGPDGYTVHVRCKSQTDMLEVGEGTLQDIDGTQVMKVSSLCKGLQAVRVRCSFAKANSGLFRVNNVKIHGNPYK